VNGLILLVEDNEQILYGNKRLLLRRGYDVMTALTLTQARECMAKAQPSAIVLDIMMPDGSGLDFMQELRRESNIPILLLTGLAASEDIVCGLAEGGDDYLTKPYDFNVLLARIEALLRRAKSVPEILRKGTLTLNVMEYQAYLNGEDMQLTQKDFALLLLFAQNQNKVMRGEYLYEKVWKSPFNASAQALKSAVSRLRKKLEGSGYTISSLRNEGYLFVAE
jgi:DNA-binding response OmpR family regulator